MSKNNKFHPYVMDYIDDPPTYKAVMWAVDMLKEGESYNKAVAIASRYYGANPQDVMHFLSQRSSRSQANRRKRRY